MATQDRLKRNLGRIYGHSSSALLDACLGAIAERFERLGVDIPHAATQLLIPQSSEDWADLWGDVFGIARRPDEADGHYSPRIVEETIRQRPQPHALIDIVQQALGITIVIRNMWQSILLMNAFAVPPGRAPQVLNGHLAAGWVPGGVDDDAMYLGFQAPYEEGVFGVWLDIAPEDPFAYTLENVQTLLPQMLLLNELTAGTAHVLNGHLTSPDLGGPTDTAKYLFQVQAEEVPTTVSAVMALIDRHRAAGTEAIFMGFVM